MKIRQPKSSSRFGYGFPFVGLAALATAAILAGGFSLAILPGIIVAGVIWAIIWVGGAQIGDALADWLERRWGK